MACDICRNNEKPLESLREIYQTAEVKQICPDCSTVLNKELRKIQDVATAIQVGWFKNLIARLRSKT